VSIKKTGKLKIISVTGNRQQPLHFLPTPRYSNALDAMTLCMSVCMSQARVLSKWLNGSDWFLAQTLPRL